MRTPSLAALLVSCGCAASGASFERGHASVNGLRMYYEIHGRGEPLVLLHGGGSTIDTTFGAILPHFAKRRKVIAIEEQAHGRTSDRERPLGFEQSADDVAALLAQLKVEKADFMGFSNGGDVAMQVAIRHPKLVRRLVAASSMTTRDGLYPQFWESMKHAELANMPRPLKDAYLKVAPDPAHLQVMHDKCVQRMLTFQDWPARDVKSIKARTLILIGDADIVRPEHAVELFRQIPEARLAILPGGHGDYLGEICSRKPGSRCRS